MRGNTLAFGRLAQLRSRGIPLCIDDFGTGYSSLRYVREFAVDAIKIDRSFVENPDGTLGSAPIVRMLIAARRGLRVGRRCGRRRNRRSGRRVARAGLPLRARLLLFRPMSAAAIGRLISFRPRLHRLGSVRPQRERHAGARRTGLDLNRVAELAHHRDAAPARRGGATSFHVPPSSTRIVQQRSFVARAHRERLVRTALVGVLDRVGDGLTRGDEGVETRRSPSGVEARKRRSAVRTRAALGCSAGSRRSR